MKEIEILLKTVADGLKTMADGLTMIAKKVDSVAKSQAGKIQPKAKPLSSKTHKTTRQSGRRTRSKGAGPLTAKEKVFSAIQKSPSGVDNATLSGKTGLDKKQVANALFRLKKEGRIQALRRGVYTAT